MAIPAKVLTSILCIVATLAMQSYLPAYADTNDSAVNDDTAQAAEEKSNPLEEISRIGDEMADKEVTKIASVDLPLRDTLKTPAASDGPLTPGAREAANLVGILPEVERLISMRRTTSSPGMLSDDELALRVFLLDKIMGESLEVRMVADRIDRELAWSYTGRGAILAARQRNLNYSFMLNFLQGGILGINAGGQFLQHKSPHAKIGAQLLLLGSSIGLGLSLISFGLARVGSRAMDGETTVLANVLDLSPPEGLHHPEVILKYLNSAPPGTATTRRQALVESWQRRGYFKPTSPETRLQKLAAYQKEGIHYREDPGLLGARIQMLHDTQWVVEQLDADLLSLLRAADVN